MRIPGWALGLAFVLQPADSSAARPVDANAKFEADLRVLADFFLPRDAIVLLISGACRTAYQTKLSRTPSSIALEQEMPGIQARMVAAAGDHCDREAPAIVQGQRDRIMDDWRASITPTELQWFVNLVHDEVEQAARMRVDVRAGETATEAVRRTATAKPVDSTLFDKQQRAMASTPERGRLLDRVARYQAKVKQDAEAGQWLMPLLKQAFERSHNAANLYARAKGYSDPYPVR